MAPHSSVLAWRIPGTVEPGGLPSMGSHRVGHDWSDLAAAAWAGTLQTATDPTLPSVMPTLPRATHHLAGPAGMSVWKYMELTHYILKAQHNSCLVGRTLICWLCLVHERITCSAWKTIGVSGLSLRGDGWSLSDGPLFGTLWAAAHQAPLPMEFSRQEYWSG